MCVGLVHGEWPAARLFCSRKFVCQSVSESDVIDTLSIREGGGQAKGTRRRKFH